MTIMTATSPLTRPLTTEYVNGIDCLARVGTSFIADTPGLPHIPPAVYVYVASSLTDSTVNVYFLLPEAEALLADLTAAVAAVKEASTS
jgi:hypothetical protein